MRSTLEKRLEKSAKSFEEQRREKQRKLARWEDSDGAFDKYEMFFDIMTMIGDDYDEVESQAEREQLRETTTRSEVEKRSRRRSSTVESAGGHHQHHPQEVKKGQLLENIRIQIRLIKNLPAMKM